jgi:RHS repeat-associated protein
MFNPFANVNDNKLVGTNYDAVGNTKIDANGQTFTYDAENKQVQVNNANGIVGHYYYDGDGKRVKKYVPSTSETTIFVYDASGKMVAEYSTVTASQSEAKISYLTNDHLGSPRITTDATGKVISRRDFMPFGEEIPRANYGSDSVRQKFTGYERDGETGLDYAKARMFGSVLGRFTSPDPYLPSAEVDNPQTWNRYVYVLNNPLRYIDSDGLNYSDLVGKQKDLIDAHVAEYNKKNKTTYTAEDFYDGNIKDEKGCYDDSKGFNDSQRATYEGVTGALMNTTLTDKNGKSLGNALDLVEKIDIVAGKIKGKGGDEQFRVYVQLTSNAESTLKAATHLEYGKNTFFHAEFENSYRQERKDGKKGLEAGFQISATKDYKRADIDVDYRFGFAHVKEDNSNVQAEGNFQKQIDRFPGMRNWWEKKK